MLVRLAVDAVSDTALASALVPVVRVTALAPALKLEVPVTASAAVWVIAPVAATVRVPPIVEAPSWVAIALVMLALPVVVTATAPVNALPALVSVTVPPVALIVVEPLTLIAALWVIAPLELSTRLSGLPAPPVFVMPPPPIVIVPVALRVRVAAPPVLLSRPPATLTVMLPACAPAPVVWIVTFVPASRSVMITDALATEELPVGVKMSVGLPPLNEPFEVPESWIVTS